MNNVPLYEVTALPTPATMATGQGMLSGIGQTPITAGPMLASMPKAKVPKAKSGMSQDKFTAQGGGGAPPSGQAEPDALATAGSAAAGALGGATAGAKLGAMTGNPVGIAAGAVIGGALGFFGGGGGGLFG